MGRHTRRLFTRDELKTKLKSIPFAKRAKVVPNSKGSVKPQLPTRVQIQESFSPDITDALRPEPQGMFKAIAEQNKLSGGLFESARSKVNESFKEPREKQFDNIQIAQKTLPTFSEIFKRLFGL